MRQVREVLRLTTARVGLKEIARRVGVAPSTVRLTWPPMALLGAGGRKQRRPSAVSVISAFVARPRQAATNLVGELLAKFERPLPHGFVADNDAAGG
jgi:hypothetical protein